VWWSRGGINCDEGQLLGGVEIHGFTKKSREGDRLHQALDTRPRQVYLEDIDKEGHFSRLDAY